MTGAERLLAACRREAVDATPVWFMRQAGGSLPGYLAMRERLSVEGIAADPDRCAEVSVMPVEAYGVDGAVMFADIMLPLAAMGVSLTLTPAGPVVEAPIRSAADVDRLRPLDPDADLPSILGAIRLVRAALAGRAATIGITGAPYTLASYLIEGGPSRDQARARAFMYRETAAWARLMHRLATAMAAYATAQVHAGAQVIQVFDSWAGALGPDAYRLGAAPYSRQVFDAIERAGVPSIHFVAASAGILEPVADAGGDVIAIDAGQALGAAWGRVGEGRAIQGNLDPARLLAGWPAVEAGARAVLWEAAGRPGHIFNLGHAAPRETDPAILRGLTDVVHDATAAAAPARLVSPSTAPMGVAR